MAEAGDMPHNDFVKFVHQRLNSLFSDDVLLLDLPKSVTLEEVQNLTALEYGQVISVNVLREDGDSYSVIVQKKATVLDLKNAIQRHVMLKLERENSKRAISWRYIWRTYDLCYEDTKLTDDHKQLKDYGIRNKDDIEFVKKIRNKQ